jgi:hypothetical protein
VSAGLVADVLSLVRGDSEGLGAPGTPPLEGQALEQALLGLLKPRLNSLQNHAYAMGHQTILEESGPPRQDCRQWTGK